MPEAAAAAVRASLQQGPHGQMQLSLEHPFAAAHGPQQQKAPQPQAVELFALEVCHLEVLQQLYCWLTEGRLLLEKANLL